MVIVSRIKVSRKLSPQLFIYERKKRLQNLLCNDRCFQKSHKELGTPTLLVVYTYGASSPSHDSTCWDCSRENGNIQQLIYCRTLNQSMIKCTSARTVFSVNDSKKCKGLRIKGIEISFPKHASMQHIWQKKRKLRRETRLYRKWKCATKWLNSLPRH